MKNALIISDLYGLNHKNNHHNYLNNTAKLLQRANYNTRILSAPQLASIPTPQQLTQQELHDQFVKKHALNSAVNQLIQSEEKYHIAIGFSIGGTILYQAAHHNQTLFSRLICISSTRLRHEKLLANCNTLAIFGKNDPHSPTIQQLNNLKINYRFLDDHNHDFYKNINNYNEHISSHI